MQNIGNRTALGAAWALLYKLVERGLGLISTLILVRLLSPDDFGLIAVATAIVALLDILKYFGFDAALIQLRDAQKVHFDTAWTFAAILGLATGFLLLILAAPIADFYDDARLKNVLLALALAAILNGFESNGPVAFRKELQWREDFIFQSTRKMAAVILTIPLAFLWRDYWALVVGIVGGRLASLIVSYVITPHRPRFTLVGRTALWSFSKWMLVTNLMVFVRQRLPNLVIGKVSSTAAVGYFQVAREVTRLPTTELSVPINRAAFPAYSKIAGNLPRLRAGFLKLTSAVAVAVMPAGVGVALTADLIVRIFLGEKWLPAVPAFQVLGVYGAIAALQSNSQALYFAVGRPKLQALMLGIFVSVLLALVFTLTPRYGHVGAAWAYLIAALVAVPIDLSTLCRCVEAPRSSMVKALWRPIAATISMAAALLLTRSWFDTPHNTANAALQLSILISAGAVSYVLALGIFWQFAGRPDGAEQWFLDNGMERLRRRRVASSPE